MRLTSKGQVTIPQHIREKLDLRPGIQVDFDIVGDSVRIRRSKSQDIGRRLVAHMRGRGTGKLTTDQIMAMTRGED
jgi:AbrB family looped-hinge helix DNA binding protein